jgi:hypothetical protein
MLADISVEELAGLNVSGDVVDGDEISIDQDQIDKIIEEGSLSPDDDNESKKLKEKVHQVTTSRHEATPFTGHSHEMLPGTVLSFNQERKFGFILTPNGQLYFHVHQWNETVVDGLNIKIVRPIDTDEKFVEEIAKRISVGTEVLYVVKMHERGGYACPWVFKSDVVEAEAVASAKVLYKCEAHVSPIVANNQTKTFTAGPVSEVVTIFQGTEKSDCHYNIKQLVASKKGCDIKFVWSMFDDEELSWVQCKKPW